MKITFLGATETVTGSKYLIQTPTKKILVDCGLFQGYKKLRLRNWRPLPIAPATIDAVLLTHAHIDHSGYLPKLCKNGFQGKIYCSPATRDLCTLLLPDSGYLQEEEARLANRYRSSKHQPALPLYTKDDAEACLLQFVAKNVGDQISLDDELSFKLYRVGHILGANCIKLFCEDTTILFSGDVGRFNDPVMKPPSMIDDADYLVIESTYGDREHPKEDVTETLAALINQTVSRGGKIIIPSFAVGRAQTLLYYIHLLKIQKQIPEVPVYLDSPMATNATEIWTRYPNEHQLSKSLVADICQMPTYVKTPEQSKALDVSTYPSIIISASGMVTGGRVLHHMRALATDHRNTIIFTGYQSAGTRGDKILRGKPSVKIFGDAIPIRAQVESLDSLSAHADANELLRWMKGFKRPPRKVYITHGEPQAQDELRLSIEEKLGWNCEIPEYCQEDNL